MMTPRALRRASLNGAGLALLASLACATPAAAQTMNVADTLAYINEQCEGHSAGFVWWTTTTGRLTLSGASVTVTDNTRAVHPSSDYDSTSTFDIRQVDISLYRQGVIRNGEREDVIQVQFGCGVGRCITSQVYYINRSTGPHTENSRKTGAVINCRQP
jgi:hypothetical protein